MIEISMIGISFTLKCELMLAHSQLSFLDSVMEKKRFYTWMNKQVIYKE